MKWIFPIAGTAVILLTLLDVFLTALVARIGTSIFSERLIAATWLVFRGFGRFAGRYRDMMLSFAGPFALILMIVVWIAMLMGGFAMLILPSVGHSFTATPGGSPANQLMTAIYISGSATTTAGPSDIGPRTSTMRAVLVLASTVGISIFTLTVSYLIQIYNALLQRNALATTLHLATARTGDAAEWIARLGAAGDFSEANSELCEIAGALAMVYEAHHFYSSLLYFRFSQDRYSVGRGGLIVMDTVTLIRAVLDEEEYAHFTRGSGVGQLWHYAMNFLDEFADPYLPAKELDPRREDDPEDVKRWQLRASHAIDRLQKAGIKVVVDRSQAISDYVSMRSRWNSRLAAFAQYMDHEWKSVAPADFPEPAPAIPD